MKEKLVRFLKRILGIQSPSEWYLERFAGEARGIFCYPKGVWYEENTCASCKDCPTDINEKGENNESK